MLTRLMANVAQAEQSEQSEDDNKTEDDIHVIPTVFVLHVVHFGNKFARRELGDVEFMENLRGDIGHLLAPHVVRRFAFENN